MSTELLGDQLNKFESSSKYDDTEMIKISDKAARAILEEENAHL
jgi:hypothetical protein